MALLELELRPSRSQLRWFGALLFPGFFAGVGGIVLYATGSWPAATTIWLLAAGVSIVGLLVPPILHAVYLLWMHAVYPIGWVVSHALLAFIYFAAMTPLGWLLRLVRRDPLARKLDRSATTHWVRYDPPDEVESYFRQY